MLASHATEPIVEAEALNVRQPKCFEDFRCIGADCEDTCCAGWGIVVDRKTYDKYQNFPAHRIADKLLIDLVEINPAGSSPGDYARLKLDGANCPALDGNLCAIQQTLGESNIPDLCSKYPRVLNVIGGTLEKSLHLSCPEAARLVLNDAEAMAFHEFTEERLPYRAGSLNSISEDVDGHLYRVRSLVIELIRKRSLPLWQRLVCLGLAVDRIADAEMASAGTLLEDYLHRFRQGSFDEVFRSLKPDPEFQLETVLELVVARIGSDYTSPRFLECYKDFMHGLAWTPESSMEELTARCCLASQRDCQPFLDHHPHLLENFLVNYVFRTAFPYCSRLPDRKFAIDSSEKSMKHSYVLLTVHYAIIRTLFIGMAARHKESLSMEHAVKLVQSYSKAFLHSSSFEAAAIEYLTKTLGDPALKVTELVMGDPS